MGSRYPGMEYMGALSHLRHIHGCNRGDSSSVRYRSGASFFARKRPGLVRRGYRAGSTARERPGRLALGRRRTISYLLVRGIHGRGVSRPYDSLAAVVAAWICCHEICSLADFVSLKTERGPTLVIGPLLSTATRN